MTHVVHLVTLLDVGGAQETVVHSVAGLGPDVRSTVVAGEVTEADGPTEARLRAAGAEVVRVPSLVRALRPDRDLRAVRDLTAVLGDLAPDVVHTHSSKAGIVGRWAAARARVPTVVHTVHGWSFRETDPALVRAGYAAAERWAARRCHELVVVAGRDREVGLGLGIGTPEQYRVVRSGIDLATFTPGPTGALRRLLAVGADVPLVGMVARLAAPKQPLVAVEAIGRLGPSAGRPAPHLVLVGDGPLQDEVRRRSAELGCAERVHLLGARTDVADLAPDLDVAVLASATEGLPRWLVEAMAAGVPVVASAVGGVPELITDGHDGLLVAPSDPGAMAAAVARSLADPAAAARRAARARLRAEAFGVDAMVDGLRSAYGLAPRATEAVIA